MRIIFLDIDGVLNSEEDPDFSKELFNPVDINPKFIKRLNKIIEDTGANVVISSSWRRSDYGTGLMGLTIDELRAGLKGRGFTGQIVSVTPHLYRTFDGKMKDRTDEIQKWLDDCEYEIESFVILDDYWPIEFTQKFPDNFVHQVGSLGLQEDQMNKAIEILTKSQES
jgi:hypothetical protein